MQVKGPSLKDAVKKNPRHNLAEYPTLLSKRKCATSSENITISIFGMSVKTHIKLCVHSYLGK